MEFLQTHVHFLFFSTFLILLPFFCAGEDPLNIYCENGDVVPSDATKFQITRVLKFVVDYASEFGYYNYAEGDGSDRIYGLAQCRRDVSPAECSACLADARDQLAAECPDKVDSRIWFDHCFVRYDNKNFLRQLDMNISFEGADDDTNVTEPERFDVEVRSLFYKVRQQVVQAENKGLGKAQTQFTPSLTLYALLQCTEDLMLNDCAVCLAWAEQAFRDLCLHKTTCRVAYSSCYMRYAFQPF